MLRTPPKLAAVMLSTAGTLPLKLPSEQIYEPHKNINLTFQITYVFVKYISPSPILEVWYPLIFINLMSNLKVGRKAVKHH